MKEIYGKSKVFDSGSGTCGIDLCKQIKTVRWKRKQKQEDFADPVRWMEVLLILAEVIFSMSDGQK